MLPKIPGETPRRKRGKEKIRKKESGKKKIRKKYGIF
jgi:hypothetical protein